MVEVSAFVDLLRSYTPKEGLPIKTVRQQFSQFYLSHQGDLHPAVEPVLIRDDLAATWIPGSDPEKKAVILFFHGGGFSIGSTADHIGLCSRLAGSAGVPVLGVDYRLVPEFSYPAPVEDAVDAYRFLLAKGYKASSIVPVGISAGGTLVLSLLIAARDRGLLLPSCAVCMSPAVSMLFEGRSVVENLPTDWITAERLDAIRRTYLRGTDPKDPLASPLYADLTGLPPMLIQAGGGELLRDDIISFVEKARKAGVEVEFELWEGMFHCWQVFAGELAEGDEAVQRVGEYIRERVDD